MSRRDRSARRHARKDDPSELPADFDFSIAAYEQRALRAIHDAMLQQLEDRQGEKAARTAILLLERLPQSWMGKSLLTVIEAIADGPEDAMGRVRDTLRLFATPPDRNAAWRVLMGRE